MFQLKNAENVDDPLLRELINVHGVFRNFRGEGGQKVVLICVTSMFWFCNFGFRNFFKTQG